MVTAIVTDSTCDLPFDLADRLGVEIVPNILVIEGKETLDNREFSRPEFYRRLPQMKTLPTTATSSSGVYTELYQRLFERGVENIFSIHASGKLSGILNAVSIAAQSFPDKVRVFDSGQISLGLGFQALAAAEAAAAGSRLDEVERQAESARRRVHLVAMLDTLEYIRRSGRVSWARASLGTLLQIRPFVELKEGVVKRAGESRTRTKGLAQLLERLHKIGPLQRLAILHSNAEDDAREFLARVNSDVQTEPMVVNITTVIGSHVGPNAIGFVAVNKE